LTGISFLSKSEIYRNFPLLTAENERITPKAAGSFAKK